MISICKYINLTNCDTSLENDKELCLTEQLIRNSDSQFVWEIWNSYVLSSISYVHINVSCVLNKYSNCIEGSLFVLTIWQARHRSIKTWRSGGAEQAGGWHELTDQKRWGIVIFVGEGVLLACCAPRSLFVKVDMLRTRIWVDYIWVLCWKKQVFYQNVLLESRKSWSGWRVHFGFAGTVRWMPVLYEVDFDTFKGQTWIRCFIEVRKGVSLIVENRALSKGGWKLK